MKNEMMPNHYNLPNIRTLLTEGFTAAQLRRQGATAAGQELVNG